MDHNSRSGSGQTESRAVIQRLVPKRANEALNVIDQVQLHIGQQLKAMYDAIVEEEVPEALIELLRQADGTAAPKKAE